MFCLCDILSTFVAKFYCFRHAHEAGLFTVPAVSSRKDQTDLSSSAENKTEGEEDEGPVEEQIMEVTDESAVVKESSSSEDE